MLRKPRATVISVPRADLLIQWSVWIGWAALSISSIVLIFGWIGGYSVVVRLHPTYPAMVPTTAICIIFAGLGTLVQGFNQHPALRQAFGALMVVTIIIDNRLPVFASSLQDDDAMSIATVICSLALATSLLLPRSPAAWMGLVQEAVQTFGLCVAAIPLAGYIFNAEALFSNTVYTSMALHTAIAMFGLLLAQLLLSHESNWIGILFGQEGGSAMLRRLLPLMIFGPLLLCMITLRATEADLVTADFRLAMLACAMIISVSFAAIHFAREVNIGERLVQLTEASLLKSERQRQQAELIMERSHKIQALGELVSAVAHDFNNTLTVILGNLELITETEDDEERRIYCEEAIVGANHAVTLTRQLLASGRKSNLDTKPHVIEDLIEPTLKMFRHLRPDNVEIHTEFANRRAIVDIDQTFFQQALLNLMINARDSMPNGGAIHVTTRILQLEYQTPETPEDIDAIPEGTFATVSVRDTGEGMSPETLRRAAEPFFTTKGVGEGTGLGLAVVSGFCLQSGGNLTIESERGKGSVLTMFFPVSRVTETPTLSDMEPVAPDNVAGANVLIVDDEASVTRVVERMLTLDGHRPVVASNAEDALRLLEQQQPPPQLVITDLLMQGQIQGDELARSIRTSYPEIKVVLMSGYESDSLRRKSPLAADLPFVRKPIDRSTLRNILAECLPDRSV